MDAFFQAIDAAMAGMLSPLMRALVWGVGTGALSMGVYVLCAPQERLRELKAAQKANKLVMKDFEGEFSEMKALLKKDLTYSLTQVGISIVPFVLSVAPAIAAMYGLETAYENVAMPTLGAEWTGNFEFWYIFSLLITSLGIKFTFKIT